MKTAWLTSVLVALATLALSTAAHAAGKLISVDPPKVKQGETVLLTIRGESIPSGTLVIEFFPQHVAVLSILSASDKELTVQVKVPALAPAGVYNVMAYNQLGEEAFGQGLLTVTSSILTPLFKSWDPKAIARADNGFALLLTGDAITPEAVPHLGAQWLQGDQPLTGLTSSFSYSSGSIMCAVTGKLPSGLLRGRITMDGTAVYQVEVDLRSPTAIIGHAPTSLHSADGPQVVRLLGSDFSVDYLSRLHASLRIGRKELAATSIRFRDDASAEIEFPGPLPEGEWMFLLAQDKVVVYQGSLTVLPALPKPVAPEPEVPTVIPNPTPPSFPAVAPSDGGPMVGQADLSAIPVEDLGGLIADPGQAPASPVPSLSGVSPTTMDAGNSPFRFTIHGQNLTPELIDRLQVAVEIAGQQALQMLATVAADGLTYVFNPGGGSWPAGNGQIHISDPQGQLAPLEQDFQVVAVQLPIPPLAVPAAPVAAAKSRLHLAASSAPIMMDANGFDIAVEVSGGEGISPAQWNQARLTPGHVILAASAGKFVLEAKIVQVEGHDVLKLHYARQADQLPDAAYDALVEDLCSSGSVPLKLEWPALGVSVDISAQFERVVADSSDDQLGVISSQPSAGPGGAS